MAKYLLAYRGGSMGETPEAQAESMTAWMNWFGQLGESMGDGGAPFGESSTLGAKGKASKGGASELSGYSIIEAKTLAEAGEKAQGCPVLSSGGSIEVYETVPVG
jgi:hypothetical protein